MFAREGKIWCRMKIRIYEIGQYKRNAICKSKQHANDKQEIDNHSDENNCELCKYLGIILIT